MKLTSAVVPALVCLIACFAHAQSISVDHIEGTWQDRGTTYIEPGADVIYHLRMTNSSGEAIGGMTNGFEVYGPASFRPLVADLSQNIEACFDLTVGLNEFGVDGLGADTVGFYGLAMFEPGVPDGFDELFLTIETQVETANEGDQLCIDSAYYPPSATWKWTPGYYPDWNGPLCHEVKAPAADPIVITNCAATYTGDHCDTARYDFNADNPAGGPLTWEKISGIGDVDPETGMWTYVPSLADVTEIGNQIEVLACNEDNCSEVCHMHLFFTNEAPVFTGGLGNYTVSAGNTGYAALSADAVDCDNVDYAVVDVASTPAGTWEMDDNSLLFHPMAPDDAGQTFEFTVVAGDGHSADTGVVTFEVIETEPYEVQIEKGHNALQGMPYQINVRLNTGSERLAGFDLLISYDATALSFREALEGELYDCGWEYFTYRAGASGNCGNGCPSGIVRVVGIAETNNGAHHPDFECYYDLDKPLTLFTLDFLVTDDQTFECMYAPVRFFWMDCGDNSLAYHSQQEPMAAVQGVSRLVYQYGLEPMMEISDSLTGFPTYTGIQEECLEGGGPDKPAPVQFVDFINGGIDIICADSIDDRGDVNMNGEAHEIADAVLFSNYFIYGLSVFTINIPGQIAATDTNADGMTLTVADLVYLIRVVLGDAVPYSKLASVTAEYTIDDGIVSVDRRMGAAYVVVSGEATPRLLAEEMELRYNFDGENTHILVSSFEPGAAFDGQFLKTDAPVLSVELATYEGAMVHAKSVPAGFELEQNYPNPFNPTTRIAFRLTRASDYKLSIYNIAGQVVESFDGRAESGRTVIEWDASNEASGVYFYRLEAGQHSSARKMVLLK